MEDINNLYEFIQWCFRNTVSTIITLTIISSTGYFILDFIKALKSK